jgi:hypothetical protein
VEPFRGNKLSPSDFTRKLQASGGSVIVDSEKVGGTVSGGMEYMFYPA